MNRTTPDQRHEFYRRHLRGVSYQDIADDVGVSHGCVRNWCRHQRDGGTCESRYHRDSPGILSTFHSLVRFAILRLKLAPSAPGTGTNPLSFEATTVLSRMSTATPVEHWSLCASMATLPPT
jgi:hypothetical protein